jgi:hypothetical protein
MAADYAAKWRSEKAKSRKCVNELTLRRGAIRISAQDRLTVLFFRVE